MEKIFKKLVGLAEAKEELKKTSQETSQNLGVYYITKQEIEKWAIAIKKYREAKPFWPYAF